MGRRQLAMAELGPKPFFKQEAIYIAIPKKATAASCRAMDVSEIIAEMMLLA